MEFGLNSDSEVFSYLKRPVRKPVVRKVVKIEDVQDTLRFSEFKQTQSPILPADFFNTFFHEKNSDQPKQLAIDQQESPEQYLGTELIQETVNVEENYEHSPQFTQVFWRVYLLKLKSFRLKSIVTYKHNKKNKLYRLRRMTKLQLGLYSMAVILFIAGLGISIDGWRTNTAVHVQVNHLTEAAAALPEVQPKTDNQVAQPSTTSTGGSSSAIIPPDLPRTLKIPAIKVNARVMSLGLLKDGSIATPPPNTNRVGWYDASSKPGSAGAMIIDGHVSGLNTAGVFYGLKNLKPGDRMTIERGDGQIFTYQVVKTTSYPAEGVDMNALANPVNFSKPGLNLITCGGTVKPGTDDFDQRVIVFTEQI